MVVKIRNPNPSKPASSHLFRGLSPFRHRPELTRGVRSRVRFRFRLVSVLVGRWSDICGSIQQGAIEIFTPSFVTRGTVCAHPSTSNTRTTYAAALAVTSATLRRHAIFSFVSFHSVAFCTHTHANTHARTHTYTHIHTHIHTHVRKHAHTHSRTHTLTNAHSHERTHTHS